MSRARTLSFALLLAAAAGLLALFARPLAFWLLERRIAREFPGARGLTTAELAAWLADPARPRPLLLDVRTPEEFVVSHLAGARRIDPAAPDLSSLAELPRDTPIVTYCA